MRASGVKLVVPLVTQGELIGLLNLGPRLSDQEYSGDDRRLLESLAAQAAPAVRVGQLVREQEAEIRSRERLDQELAVARLIQQNFLPAGAPRGARAGASPPTTGPRARWAATSTTSSTSPDGRLGIVVGDVTDKGVPAALVMAATRSVLRASAQRLVEPGAVLERVNEHLVPDIPREHVRDLPVRRARARHRPARVRKRGPQPAGARRRRSGQPSSSRAGCRSASCPA